MSGVCDAGLSTTGQPAAIAGASLWLTRFSGKLNGLIAPTTPIGTRRVKPSLPTPATLASIAIISPVSVRASTAANANVPTARAASMRAVLIGFAASLAMLCASSSWRSPIRLAAASRISARCQASSGSPVSAVRGVHRRVDLVRPGLRNPAELRSRRRGSG